MQRGGTEWSCPSGHCPQASQHQLNPEREEQAERCQTCCSCERGAGRVGPVSPPQPSCPDLTPSSRHPVGPAWVMHRVVLRAGDSPGPARESSDKQERRLKQRAGLEGSSGFSASPPEVCLNPIKESRINQTTLRQ